MAVRLSLMEMADNVKKRIVVPANAGTQRRSTQDAGFPLSRERRQR